MTLKNILKLSISSYNLPEIYPLNPKGNTPTPHFAWCFRMIILRCRCDRDHWPSMKRMGFPSGWDGERGSFFWQMAVKGFRKVPWMEHNTMSVLLGLITRERYQLSTGKLGNSIEMAHKKNKNYCTKPCHLGGAKVVCKGLCFCIFWWPPFCIFFRASFQIHPRRLALPDFFNPQRQIGIYLKNAIVFIRNRDVSENVRNLCKANFPPKKWWCHFLVPRGSKTSSIRQWHFSNVQIKSWESKGQWWLIIS